MEEEKKEVLTAEAAEPETKLDETKKQKKAKKQKK